MPAVQNGYAARVQERDSARATVSMQSDEIARLREELEQEQAVIESLRNQRQLDLLQSNAKDDAVMVWTELCVRSSTSPSFRDYEALHGMSSLLNIYCLVYPSFPANSVQISRSVVSEPTSSLLLTFQPAYVRSSRPSIIPFLKKYGLWPWFCSEGVVSFTCPDVTLMLPTFDRNALFSTGMVHHLEMLPFHTGIFELFTQPSTPDCQCARQVCRLERLSQALQQICAPSPPLDWESAIIMLGNPATYLSEGKGHYYISDSALADKTPTLGIPASDFANHLHASKKLDEVEEALVHVSLGGPTYFASHLKDLGLTSFITVMAGDPKIWIAIPSSQQLRFEQLLQDVAENGFGPDDHDGNAYGPHGNTQCPQSISALSFFVTPRWLTKHDIDFTVVIQQAGVGVLTAPMAYHQGLNSGNNAAVSINAYGDGPKMKSCTCLEDDALGLSDFKRYNMM